MRNSAAFTIAQNEPVFLPLWLSYYGRYFAKSNLYVLDHDSSDGSTEKAGACCQLLRVHREKSFDHQWLRDTVTCFQAFLLQSYESVLFAEVDEFVIADPRHYSGLDDYIAQSHAPVSRCTGFHVVHYPSEEPPLRFQMPILAQRKYWHRSRRYCKPLISAVPLSWVVGFHDAPSLEELPPDPYLLLVHLHRVDYDSCLSRHCANAARNWNEFDLQQNFGWQNRVVEKAAFEEWFFKGEDDEERELIPEYLKSIL
jgi:hypothetical protein